jgi:hypothetical protein
MNNMQPYDDVSMIEGEATISQPQVIAASQLNLAQVNQPAGD